MKNVNTWLEIDSGRLIHNISQFRRVTNAQIMPIIKSNAYGHGMVQTAQAIEEHSDWLGVVNLEEAIELRNQGIKKPIFILSFFFGEEDLFNAAARTNIHFPVYTLEDGERLNRVGERANAKINVQIKIDSGTSRLGILPGDAQEFVKKIRQFPWLSITGIFSHFAASEEQQEFTQRQLLLFQNTVEKLETTIGKIPFKHFACSAAALVTPKSQFDIIRLGIALYGLWPSELCREMTHGMFPEFELKPALTWKTRILQIKTVPKGSKIGYGCSYSTTRNTKIAAIPIGYADGYDRRLSNHAQVLIGNQRCNVLGRVCMNLCMVDVTDIPTTRYDHEVVLIGEQGQEHITADELAEKIGTINYEVVTRIHPHIARIYV
ncbi:MAG TPA: alanine racemase [Patescibacteria group bacterium]|nr:alanine racemase [Patescibacteria group bacterium]